MFEVHIWRGKRPFSMSNVRIDDIRKNKIHTDMSNMAMAWLVRDPATWQPLAMDASSRNPASTLFDKPWEIKISSYLLQYMYVLSMSTNDRAFPQREQKDEGEGVVIMNAWSATSWFDHCPMRYCNCCCNGVTKANHEFLKLLLDPVVELILDHSVSDCYQIQVNSRAQLLMFPCRLCCSSYS